MLKPSVYITSLVLLAIIFSCKVSRFVVYNFAKPQFDLNCVLRTTENTQIQL
jgi:hypothetical protein